MSAAVDLSATEPYSAPPRWLTSVPEADIARGDGERYTNFFNSLCRATKDTISARAGDRLRERGWQRRLTGQVFARRPDGLYRHRVALVGMGRKNGKSQKGAGWGLAGLVLGPYGGEVYSAAVDRPQAKVVFNVAKAMVEAEPQLMKILKPYRDVIEFPATGSIYRALSAEALSQEGLNPHLVIFDEVHAQPGPDLWDVLRLAMGSRVEPMMIGITTSGVRTDRNGKDSLAYVLYEYGRRVASGEIVDDTFFMSWWEPRNPMADHRDESVWPEGNPGLGDLVSVEDMRSVILNTSEPQFRIKRINQWVASGSGWFKVGRWEACAAYGAGGHGEAGQAYEPDWDLPRVLAFDGAFTNDSTALVSITVEAEPVIEVVQAWERPPGPQGDDYQVPIADVEKAILDYCRGVQDEETGETLQEAHEVLEIAFDPARWSRTFQNLESEGLPVESFPQSPERMTPATELMTVAINQRQIRHDADPRLARHVGNAVLRTDARGSRIVKDTKNSTRKIDLAVAAIMGLSRAVWWHHHQTQSVYEQRGLVIL